MYLSSYYCFQNFSTYYSTETVHSVQAQLPAQIPEEELEREHHQTSNGKSGDSFELEVGDKVDDYKAANLQGLEANSCKQVLNKATSVTEQISSEEVVEKLAFFDDDSKENLTLSKLIDYFLGDFPSKCDTNNSTMCNSALKENSHLLKKPTEINEHHFSSGSLRRKELETADFMAQLQMTREMSFDHGAIHF